MEHSKTFGISSAGRWVECSGSVKLLQDHVPEEDTEESKQGTAVHYVGEKMLAAFKADQDHLALGESLIGTTHENGIIITEEMFDTALCYAEQIIKVVGDDSDRKAMLILEQRVEARSIDPECWGTPDAFFYDIPVNTLHVWDLKNGHGRVEVFENYQLIGYAQAICETFNYARINPRLNLNIIQPRCYDGKGPEQSWILPFDNIRGYINKMKWAVQRFRMAKSELITGSHCKYCDVSYKCAAILKAAAHVIDFSMDTIPLNMSAEAIAYEKTVVDTAMSRLKERSRAVDAQLENRIRKGEMIPGFRMDDVMGNKQWINKDPKTIEMMGKMLKVKTMNDPQPRTPTQVMKELKKNKVDESVISPYYHTTKTGVKLVADDGSKAKRIFSQEKI